MSKDFIKDSFDVGMASLKPFVSLGEFASKFIERTTEQNLKFINQTVETGTEYMKKLSSAKKIEDAFSTQAEYLAKTGTEIMNFSQESAGRVAEATAAFGQMVGEGFKSYTESTTAAATAGTKK